MASTHLPSPELACHFARYTRNRDFLEGEYAVKRKGRVYLGQASASMTPSEYQSYLESTVFWPAASRTMDGLVGLLFRKRPVFEASDVMQLMSETITVDGRSLTDLAEWAAREAMAKNWGGLLVDHPPVVEGLTAANAVEEGFRPFVAPYAAEAILEATHGVVRNRRVLVRVRLADSEHVTRELLLLNGQYVVRIHDESGDTPRVTQSIPFRDGQPLKEIPFVLLSTTASLSPGKAMLDDVISLNHSHYRHEGKLTQAFLYLSAPVPWVTGVKPQTDAITGVVTPPALDVAPGAIWYFPDTEAKVGYLEFTGAGVGSLERQRDHLEGQLARVGARVIASEKNAAEAAETHAIRRTAENATLSVVSLNISRKIEAAMQLVSDWIDAGPVKFALNTDFLPVPLTAQEITALVSAWTAGAMSDESLFYNMREGELFSHTLTFEEEEARKAASKEKAQPVVVAAPLVGETGPEAFMPGSEEAPTPEA